MSDSRIRRRQAEPCDIDWPQSVPPLLRRVYAARGIRSAGQVAHTLAGLLRPDALGGLERACALLDRAIDEHRSILIVGDYDCDGATGTAVAVRGLRLLGAQRVAYVVPNRITHGYGLSPALVDSLETVPDLLVTVDNGIASHAGVEAARARGARVIVTDHHLPPRELPAADAIVNPNLEGDDFGSKALAGVGVMFYLLLALRARRRERGDARARDADLSALLDLVALGTVADMVPLDQNNRILVAAGLKRMRDGRACAGVRALAEVARRSLDTLTSSDIGFALAPRLNAAGRLEDMRLGIECLLSDEEGDALERAQRLSAINEERRQIQADMVAEAEVLADDLPDSAGDGVVVFRRHWHPGVIGLVASRLKERLHRPVVAFAPSGDDDGSLRGSARSIPGVHVRDALVAVDTRAPGMIPRYGGHAMAAGLSLAEHDLERFSQHFQDAVASVLDDEARQALIWSDGELAADELSLASARSLRFAGPWGQAFPEPLFDNVLVCEHQRPMGRAHRRLGLRDPRDGRTHEAVMFNVAADLPMHRPLRAAYQLEVNDWNRRESLRLILRHVEDAV